MMDLEEALARLQLGQLEYAGGLSNHGPMVVEALVELGHASLIAPFVGRYAPRIPPFEAGTPIPEADRSAARGRYARAADWVATFEAQLARRPWRAVAAAGIRELAPGLFAGATHGFLRLAHAARALGRAEAPASRREIAFGLGYWAARYQELPGQPGARPEAGLTPAAALRRIVPLPDERRVPGLLTTAAAALEGDDAFQRVVAAVDLAAAAPWDLLNGLCREAARLYLEHPHARIAYVHALTAPSALRLVAPLLDADGDSQAVRRALGLAFQAAAAIHAIAAGPGAGTASSEVRRVAADPAEVRYLAACSLEEHAIKFAEACLREDAWAPDPVFRLAAADAALHLGASR